MSGDFGDGESESVESEVDGSEIDASEIDGSISHTYASAGSYSIVLTVTDEEGNQDQFRRTVILEE